MKMKLIIAVLALALTSIACSDDTSPVESTMSTLDLQTEKIQEAIDNYPTEELSDTEKDGLIFMREEEKLARDVYLYFYNKYAMKIFNNISSSETTHMEAIKMLIKKYDLIDPVINDGLGIFQNEQLAELYDQLTTAGDVSLVEALKVGATIEDLDIRDLMVFDDDVNNQDILYVYDNLTMGSRNHMRAFYPQVIDNGGTYEVQFITQELLDSIVTTPKETGSW